MTLHVPFSTPHYIILDRHLVQSMTSSRVLNEHLENVAYHLPLIINLCMTHTENIDQPYDERNGKHMRELDTSCWKKCSAEIANIYSHNFSILISEVMNKDLTAREYESPELSL